MPAANWSITIVSGASGGPATFAPNPLLARAGDVVSWNNTTREPHQIWQLDGSGNLVPMPIGASGHWEPIARGEQSPAWTIPGGAKSFQYGCLLHFNPNNSQLLETGMITIIT
jgi:plastocyanin